MNILEKHFWAGDGTNKGVTVVFPPSNIFASATLTSISARHDDHPATLFAAAGIFQITTTTSAEQFESPLPSAFRNKCTSITFEIRASMSNGSAGAGGRATVFFF